MRSIIFFIFPVAGCGVEGIRCCGTDFDPADVAATSDPVENERGCAGMLPIGEVSTMSAASSAVRDVGVVTRGAISSPLPITESVAPIKNYTAKAVATARTQGACLLAWPTV